MSDNAYPFAHHRLDVYRVALLLAAQSKGLADRIPRGYRSFADQLIRAAVSTVLLIGEGANRYSKGQKRQRYAEARGECGEVAPALEHDAGGRAQARTSDNAKWHKAKESSTPKPYYLVPVLRAVLTSAAAKPALLQLALGSWQGEAAAFDEMVAALHRAYGRSQMIDIIDGDAGLTSLRNANAVDSLGYGYVFGLKGNQRELHDEAKALLEPMAKQQAPDAETSWELRGARRIRRRLWRTAELTWRRVFRKIRRALDGAAIEAVAITTGG